MSVVVGGTSEAPSAVIAPVIVAARVILHVLLEARTASETLAAQSALHGFLVRILQRLFHRFH